MTEEPDDEQPGHQDWETYLDRLFTLLLAYALGGVKALDNAPPAKEEDALGADTTKFVYVPLDVVMRYHARARRTSASLPYASRLAWLQQRDTEERADWVSRFRESNLTLGPLAVLMWTWLLAVAMKPVHSGSDAPADEPASAWCTHPASLRSCRVLVISTSRHLLISSAASARLIPFSIASHIAAARAAR